MGKWLQEFLTDNSKSHTDKADILPGLTRMSAMSVRDLRDSAKNPSPTSTRMSALSVPDIGNPGENLPPSESVNIPTSRTDITDTLLPIQAGSFVTWASRGRVWGAFVDWVHPDQDGRTWAFVSWRKAWAAVDVRLLRLADPGLDESYTPLSDLTASLAVGEGKNEDVFDVNRPEDTTAGPGVCFSCKGTRRWLSVHGVLLCGTCHPPADRRLVVWWPE